MTVNVSKPAINLREKLAELDKPTGIAGEAMLRAETVPDQAELLGYRQQNVIINGDMQIAQRGTSITGVSDGDYMLDRWRFNEAGPVVVTASQSSDAPDGFSESLKIDVTTADTTIGSTEYVFVEQRIEGYNIKHFASGTSKAKPHTLSFWVKSNVTGTYIAELRYVTSQLEASQAYTINQADTWEYKTVVFPPQTSDAPNYDNTDELRLFFYLGAGSARSGGSALSTTWTTTDNVRAVGQVNAVDSTDNEWFVTGVQLVAGNYPDGLPFMHRSYGEELALCQRYYYRINGNSENNTLLCVGQGTSTANVIGNIPFPVTMRARPTDLEKSGTASDYLMANASGTAQDCTTGPSLNVKTSEHIAAVLFVSTGNSAQGEARQLLLDDTTNSFLSWSAEL